MGKKRVRNEDDCSGEARAASSSTGFENPRRTLKRQKRSPKSSKSTFRLSQRTCKNQAKNSDSAGSASASPKLSMMPLQLRTCQSFMASPILELTAMLHTNSHIDNWTLDSWKYEFWRSFQARKDHQSFAKSSTSEQIAFRMSLKRAIMPFLILGTLLMILNYCIWRN